MNLCLTQFLEQHYEKPIRFLDFPPSRTKIVAEDVAERFDKLDAKIPSSIDLLLLRKALNLAYEFNDPGRLTAEEWRYSPLCLRSFFAHDSGNIFFNWYFSSVIPFMNGQLARRLVLAYIENFDPNNSPTLMLASFLKEREEILGVTWQRVAKLFKLFEPMTTVNVLAGKLLDSQTEVGLGVVKTLESFGLKKTVAASRLAVCVFVQAASQATKMLRINPKQSVFQRVMSLASDGKEAFAMQARPEIVKFATEALLLPYNESNPSPECQKEIEHYLLRRLGDPRLDQAHWNPVGETARAVMRRWLNKWSLELFLQIVDKVVNTDANAKRMWSRRREFWTNYLKNGHVREAWCVFGSACAYEAHRMAQRAGITGKNFADLQAPGGYQKHAVMIMHIGSLTIADWSHNSRGHIWNRHESPAPRLYDIQYERTKLVNGSDFDYMHDQHGGWQEKVSNYIYQRTGIRCGEDRC